MRGCLGFFFYIFITIWLLFVFLFFASIRTWAFNRDFYLDVINNEALYTAFRTEALPEFLSNVRVNGQPLLNANSPAFPALVEATQAIIPENFLQDATRTIVDELFAFYENPQAGLSFQIDLTQIKANLASASGDAFVSSYVQSLEQCPPGVTSIPTNELPTCLPQGVTPQNAIAVVQDYKNVFLQQIPDVWQVSETPVNDFSSLPEGVSVGQNINLWFSVVTVMTLAVWVFNAVIAGRGFRGFLMWLGGMLFLPALIVLLSGAAFGGSLLESINRDIASSTTNALAVSSQLEQSVVDVLLNIVRQVGTGFLTIGAIGLAVSLVLYLMGAVMRRPDANRNSQIGIGGYTNDPNHPIRPL